MEWDWVRSAILQLGDAPVPARNDNEPIGIGDEVMIADQALNAHVFHYLGDTRFRVINAMGDHLSIVSARAFRLANETPSSLRRHWRSLYVHRDQLRLTQ
jgi:hypothetical protein